MDEHNVNDQRPSGKNLNRRKRKKKDVRRQRAAFFKFAKKKVLYLLNVAATVGSGSIPEPLSTVRYPSNTSTTSDLASSTSHPPLKPLNEGNGHHDASTLDVFAILATEQLAFPIAPPLSSLPASLASKKENQKQDDSEEDEEESESEEEEIEEQDDAEDPDYVDEDENPSRRNRKRKK